MSPKKQQKKPIVPWSTPALWSPALLLCGLSLAVPLQAADRANKNNEGWRILERQKWFEETRQLRDEPQAKQLKERGLQMMMQQQRSAMMRAQSSGEIWQELGPSSMDMTGWSFGRVSGRNNAIVPHPVDENILYFGAAAGGVWKTTDGGQRWTPIFDNTGTQVIGAITLDPKDPNRVWVGTGDKNAGGCAGYLGKGLFLSTDGGAQWQSKNGSGASALPLDIINSVAISPSNSAVMVVGGFGRCDSNGVLTDGGVYRSTDGGTSWSRVFSGLVEDVVFAQDGTTVYASAPATGILKSTNAGASFSTINSGLQVSQRRLRLALAPSNNNVLYAMGDNQGLYRSTNGGTSWQLMNNAGCEGQCTYNLALAVKPNDANTVLVGSIRHAISTNGGQSLRYLTSNWGTEQTVHQDTHVLTWSSRNPDRYWVGTDGGIWRSDNAGGRFVNINSNLNVTQFYDIAVDRQNPEKMFGGAQDNSSSGRTAQNGKIWQLTYASGDGFMNVIAEDNANYVFQTSYPNGGLPWIVRSTNGGAPNSFSQIANTGLASSNNFPWVMPMAGAGDRIWVASDRVYVANTTASSVSWSALSGNLGSAGSVLKPLRINGTYHLWVASNNGKIFKSSNPASAGGSLVDITNNYPGGRISDIAVDASNLNRIFVTRSRFQGDKLYRTSNGGSSWEAVGAGLPSVPATAVAIDPSNNQRIFVGTDIGMFESRDGGLNFTSFNSGMPLGNTITDLEVNPAKNLLIAASYGRGAWQISLNSNDNPNQPPSAAFRSQVDGLTVRFTDQSSDPDGQISSWRWNFGDGTSSTEANPQKQYNQAGTYTVNLTVQDERGAANSRSETVTVTAKNQAPVANFTISKSGLSVDFSDASRDADGRIVSYAWDFGDDTTSTDMNPRKTYNREGSYAVRLTVTDNQGAQHSVTQTVTVSASNQAPVANFNVNSTYLTVQFENLSRDPDGSIASYAWQFGDDSRPSSDENPTHTYASAGSYNVQLTVTDNQGEQANFSRVVEVTAVPGNAAPAANFSHQANGLQVQFTDASTDADGSVVSWHWSFGDLGSSTERNPQHRYQAEGSYAVELMVKDNAGASNVLQKTVVVTKAEQPDQCTGTIERGYLWGLNGETYSHPNGAWYYSAQAGEHSACITATGNLTLALERWNGWWWTPVKTGTTQVSYQGNAGYYRFVVSNQGAVGEYQIQYRKPN